MALELYGCAALCAVGMVLGLLRVVGELNDHLAAARDAVGLVGVTIATAVVAGLLAPQRIIRRQLSGLDGHAPADDAGVGFEFAASLVGLLVLTLGALGVLLVGLTAAMESYRGWLTLRFVHPPWLTRGLLVTPVVVGLGLTSVAGTVVLAALHGWHRLACGSGAGAMRLWVAMLSAATVGALAVALLHRPVRLDFPALLALFAAAALAVARRSPEQSAVDPRSTECPAPSRSRLGRMPRSLAVWPMLVASAAWASVGLALAVAAPLHPLAPRTAAIGLAAIGSTGLLGIVAVRLVARGPGAGRHSAPWLLLLLAVVWVFPGVVPGVTPLGRAALASGLASACSVLAGRRLARVLGRAQPALVGTGVAGAVGLAFGVLLGPFASAALDSPRAPILTSLVLTATAGLGLILSGAASTRRRVTGLGAVALWLVLLLLGPHPSGGDARTSAPAPPIAPASSVPATRAVLATPGLRVALVTTSPNAPAPDSAWNVDLGGPRFDLVVVTGPTVEARQAGRLLRRCLRALLPGGRIAIELPADELADAAFATFPSAADAPVEAVLLCVHTSRSSLGVLSVESDPVDTALVFGLDASAWLGQRIEDRGDSAELFRVHGRGDAARLLADIASR